MLASDNPYHPKFAAIHCLRPPKFATMQPELTEQILQFVDQNGSVDTLDLVTQFGLDHQKIVGAVKSIEAHGDLLHSQPASRKNWALTSEGQAVVENGSHEAAVFRAIPEEGISQADLMKVRCVEINNV